MERRRIGDVVDLGEVVVERSVVVETFGDRRQRVAGPDDVDLAGDLGVARGFLGGRRLGSGSCRCQLGLSLVELRLRRFELALQRGVALLEGGDPIAGLLESGIVTAAGRHPAEQEHHDQRGTQDSDPA
ncbi:MAG: hypothetical protein ACLGHL_02795, partial [Actinomycetota bacterium]